MSSFSAYQPLPEATDAVIGTCLGVEICATPDGIYYLADNRLTPFLLLINPDPALGGHAKTLSCGHPCYPRYPYLWFPAEIDLDAKDCDFSLCLACGEDVRENAYGTPCFTEVCTACRCPECLESVV